MSATPRVLLLIDADNVSTDVIEQAVSRLHAEYGALHVRRAYGTAENAVKHQRLFKRLSIRPMVNLATGKNSTDIALAVDALDLVIAEHPDVVVIASSDSDFAPLVARMREKGCLVRGVGQKGKVGEETPLIYDDFIEFEHRAARGTRARKDAAADAPAAQAPARKTAARKTSTRSGGASAATAAGEPAPLDAAAAKTSAPPAKAPRKTSARKATTSKVAAVDAAAVPKAAAAADAPRKTAARKTAATAASAALPAVAPAAAAAAPAPAAAAAAGAATPAANAAAAATPPATAALPEKVARALAALPALAAGERVDVQSAAAVLRKERVFSLADSWPKFFERYKDWFELSPAGRPTHVQRRRTG